jgi:Lhr-like helicase
MKTVVAVDTRIVTAARPPLARSSTSATRRNAISRSSCRRRRSAPVMSNDQWEQVYGRVAELVWQHRTTLVFVNTRRMAERGRAPSRRAARQGGGRRAPRQPREGVRLDAEQRLKRGD